MEAVEGGGGGDGGAGGEGGSCVVVAGVGAGLLVMANKGREGGDDGLGCRSVEVACNVANGKDCSSKVTWREMIIRQEDRSKQWYP